MAQVLMFTCVYRRTYDVTRSKRLSIGHSFNSSVSHLVQFISYWSNLTDCSNSTSWTHYNSLSVLTTMFPGQTGLAGFTELRMMEVVMKTGATSRAKFQSNRHHQQTNTQLFTGRMPSCHPTNSVRALKENLKTSKCKWSWSTDIICYLQRDANNKK